MEYFVELGRRRALMRALEAGGGAVHAGARGVVEAIGIVGEERRGVLGERQGGA